MAHVVSRRPPTAEARVCPARGISQSVSVTGVFPVLQAAPPVRRVPSCTCDERPTKSAATALLKNTSQPEHTIVRPKAFALLLYVFCVCSLIYRPLLRTVFYGRRAVPHGDRAQLCTVQITADKAGLRGSAYITLG